MAPYLPCKICKQTNFDPNTHQCNWAVLKGKCEHTRKWEMKTVKTYANIEGAIQFEVYAERDKALDEGWEPMSVSSYGVEFRRLKPCEECKKV